MNKYCQVLRSQTLFVATLVAAIALVVSEIIEECLERRSALGRLRQDDEIVGVEVDRLFRRSPVVPDRIMYWSEDRDSVVLVYHAERIGWRHYPYRLVFVSSNRVVHCQSD